MADAKHQQVFELAQSFEAQMKLLGPLGLRCRLERLYYRLTHLTGNDAVELERGERKTDMKQRSFLKALGAVAVPVAVGLVILSSNVTRAGDKDDDKESRVKIGFQIAPVPLNLKGKNSDLVGYGSYLVNAVAGCNGCHTNSPSTEYSLGGNPYLRFPTFFTGTKKVNTATYLAGGRDFGPIGSVPHLYSRNLTPDKTRLPEGGHTFGQFVAIMRHGTDFDHVHPNCTGPNTPKNCFVPPFNGDLLQVMPWPDFQSMTDHDLRAMYEYLSAIPCNPGPVIAGAPYLQNVCH